MMMSDGDSLRGASYTSIILQNTEQVKSLLGKEKNMLTTENTFKDYPDIVSFKQMMEMLHIGRNKACTLLRNDIPSIRIGCTHKIPKVNIIDYINRKSIEK